MEMYLWIAFGLVTLGFFAYTYWEVFRAYRAYLNSGRDAETQRILNGPRLTA